MGRPQSTGEVLGSCSPHYFRTRRRLARLAFTFSLLPGGTVLVLFLLYKEIVLKKFIISKI